MREVRHTMMNNPHLGRLCLSASLACFTCFSYSQAAPFPLSASAQDEAVAAHKLTDSANADIKELDRVWAEAEKQVDKLEKADLKGDPVEVKSLLQEMVGTLDEALKLMRSALNKIERAAGLNIHETYKKYLNLKTQSLHKEIEAFTERRAAAQLMRYNYAGADKERERRIREEFRQKNQNYKRLISEADELGDEADEVAAQNPDVIPPNPEPDQP
jgi:hypothetical protein